MTDFSSATFQTFDTFAALPAARDFFWCRSPGSVFVTDVRYDTQAHDEVKGAKVIIARKALLEALAEVLAQRKTARRKRAIAIESEHLTVAEKKRLTKFRAASITLKDVPGMVEKARMVKDNV